MLIKLVAILMLQLSLCSLPPLTGCIYNQKIYLYNGSGFSVKNQTNQTNQTVGYSYQITWDSTQNNITSSSFVLMGFRIKDTNILFSYDANLTNLTDSGGTFIFNPQTNTSIIYIYFGIVLVQTCYGYIQLQLNSFQPTQFIGRTSQVDAYTNITLQKGNFTNKTQRYITQAFISAFYINSSTNCQALSIVALPITLNTNVQKIKALSGFLCVNIYPRVWYTYIMIDLFSFFYHVNAISIDSGLVILPAAVTNNLAINVTFKPFFRNCLIGMKTIIMYKDCSNNCSIYLQTSSNAPTADISNVPTQSFQAFGYTSVCTSECAVGQAIIVTNKTANMTFGCYSCSRTQCQSCDQDGNCTICKGNKFLFVANSTMNVYMVAGITITNSTNNTLSFCLTTCPMKYYRYIVNQTCLPCKGQCKTCSDNLNCDSCEVGWPVEGGCTTIDGCVQMAAPLCIKCLTTGHFIKINYTCFCQDGYYLVSHLCVNVFGCVGAKKVLGRQVCIACNSMLNFVLSNNNCTCKDGYYKTDTACMERCGDGKVYTLGCDDGNTINGDGCSSDCKEQKNYTCNGGSPQIPSFCVLTRDITLKLLKTYKAGTTNSAVFVFSVYPLAGRLGLMNLNNMVTFQCNRSISLSSVSYESGNLTVRVNYFQDLEGYDAYFTLSLSPNYFTQANTSISFKMTGKLILTEGLGKATIYRSIFLLLCCGAISILTISLFVHKMIGVELIQTFQIIYITHLGNNNYTQSYGMLKYLYASVWNLSLQEAVQVNLYMTNSQNAIFSIQYQQNTVNFMGGILFFAIFLLLGLKIAKNILEQRDHPLLPRRIKKWIQLGYNHILYPLSMAFFFVSLLITNNQCRYQFELSSTFTQKMVFFLMVLVTIIFFYEWKVGFITENIGSEGFQRVQKCNRNYLSVYLSYIIAIFIIISYQMMNNNFFSYTWLSGISFCFLLYLLSWRPYENCLHNIGIISNLLVLLIFMGWNVLRHYQQKFTNSENEMNVIHIIIGLMALLIFLNLGRVIYEIKLKCKKTQIKKKSKKSKRKQAVKLMQRYPSKLRDEFASGEYAQFNNTYIRSLMREENIFQKKRPSLAAINTNYDNGQNLGREYRCNNLLISNDLEGRTTKLNDSLLRG